METEIKYHSQWFLGKENIAANVFYWDNNQSDSKLTIILTSLDPRRHLWTSKLFCCPTRLSLGLPCFCSSCPRSSSYAKHTLGPILGMVVVDPVMQLHQPGGKPSPWKICLPPQTQALVSICHGFKWWAILGQVEWPIGWGNSLQCHFTCGT